MRDTYSNTYLFAGWRPYESLEEAIKTIGRTYRIIGTTIKVRDKNGVEKEYWWRDGIENKNLVEKPKIKSQQ